MNFLFKPSLSILSLGISMPGIGELLVILVIVLVVFGPNKLPLIGESIGKTLKGFKKAISNEDEIDVTPPKQISENQNNLSNKEHLSQKEEQKVK